MKTLRVFIFVAASILAAQAFAPAARSDFAKREFDGTAENLENSRTRPTVGARGMVVADDRIAAEWGAEILRRGGNAIDAAVATHFAMAVTRPYFAALGGGGFLVYCPKPTAMGPSACQTLDFREMAPSAATRTMYLRDGKPRTDLSQDTVLGVGVPGNVAGLTLALKTWGTRPLAALLSRPIELAERGTVSTGGWELSSHLRWDVMNAEGKKIFGCGVAKKPCPPGTLVKQRDLGRVLRQIVRHGRSGFYEGWVARKIAASVREAGGILSEADLKAYHAVLRVPVVSLYRGYEVVSMPPPSAGGALMEQMLGYMERAENAGVLSDGFGSSRTVHAEVHAMALAFADRAAQFGDPDFVKVPLARLLSTDYLDSRWKSFDPAHAALPSGSGLPAPHQGRGDEEGLVGHAGHAGMNTTHFSVIDREGNAVAITTTLNDHFGSAFVVPGTGVVLNNEMDDFSIAPGVPNMFGLVGDEANSIAPGKRPLSSMSPTVVRDPLGHARFVLGAEGGPRITSAVFQVVFNRLALGLSLPDAVAAARVHQQWRPESVTLEEHGFSVEVQDRLRKLGYDLNESGHTAKVHALERFDNGRVWGVPDPRGEGAAVAE